MQKGFNLLALSLIFALGACTPVPAPIPTPVKLSRTIAQVAGGDFIQACSVWAQAVKYYNDVAFVVNIASPATASAASLAIDGGNALCSLPSGNVARDLATLNALWAKIQAYTTVPKK